SRVRRRSRSVPRLRVLLRPFAEMLEAFDLGESRLRLVPRHVGRRQVLSLFTTYLVSLQRLDDHPTSPCPIASHEAAALPPGGVRSRASADRRSTRTSRRA